MFYRADGSSNYTVEADVRANMKRRQMGDIGIIAQRYSLVLYGNNQYLKIEPWEPEVQRTVTVPFEWKQDKWYHLKLRVDNLRRREGADSREGLADGRSGAGGVDDRENRSDRQSGGPCREYSPTREFGAYLDNLKVTANQ